MAKADDVDIKESEVWARQADNPVREKRVGPIFRRTAVTEAHRLPKMFGFVLSGFGWGSAGLDPGCSSARTKLRACRGDHNLDVNSFSDLLF